MIGIPSCIAVNADVKTISPVSFDGNMLYVGGSGPNNYTSIQDAIDDAEDGDTVFVYDDSSPYYENVVVDKSIDLIGECKNNTVISGSGDEFAVCFSAKKINIKNFTITSAHYGIKITLNSGDIIIENCNISNNFYGIEVCNSSNILIKNCITFDNTNGIYLFGSDCFITDCTFINRQKNIWFAHAQNNIVTHCTFSESNPEYLSHGLYFYSSVDNKIKHCKIYKTHNGISFYTNSYYNEIVDCIISNTEDRGVVFSDSANNHLLNTTISNNYGEFNGYAIEFFGSYNNFIESCNISNNPNGGIMISFSDNHDNYIFHSTFYNNGLCAIVCSSGSYNNYIYKNNFIKNPYPSYDVGYNNAWDTGNHGNYWDTYTGSDDNNDGIGDTPYDIEGDVNMDKFPLMLPFLSGPSLKIKTPKEGYLYIRSIKLPFLLNIIKDPLTLVLGNIKILASAANYNEGEEIDRVEFYVDDILRKTDTKPPYSWRWRLSSHIKHRHTIKVVAYDNVGDTASDEIEVLRFF